MKLLIQRVLQASVEVKGEVVGRIGPGAVIFIGIAHGDQATQASQLASKLIHLRIFEDTHGKMNQSLLDRKGEALIISQFTLYADCSEGRRPSFIQAAPPEIANPLYEHFINEVRRGGISVATGIFGADMKVSLINDGPVTLILEK